jgi:hypothetical protein
MSISAEHLLSVVQNYWRSDHEFHGTLERSPELKRFQALWKQKLEKIDEWWVLHDELRAALPHLKIGDATNTVDACFRCLVYADKALVSENPEDEPRSRCWAVVGCVSILAPVYTVYGVQYDYKGRQWIARQVFFEPLPPEMRAPAEVVAKKLEKLFGVEALPREIAEIRIPLIVERQQPPETTLFHALFTSEPENVPL